MIWPSLLRYRVPFWPGRGMSVITIRASKRWIEITARTPCKSKDNTFPGVDAGRGSSYSDPQVRPFPGEEGRALSSMPPGYTLIQHDNRAPRISRDGSPKTFGGKGL